MNVYSRDEVKKLFEIVQGSSLEIPVKLATFYGLRRSEVVGLKWEAIHFVENTITIHHTVTSHVVDGNPVEIASYTMKSMGAIRTLPLVQPFRDILLQAKEEQETNRYLCGDSYCTVYLDYVCVNTLGELIKLDDLTTAFQKLLETHNMRLISFHSLRGSCAHLLQLTDTSPKRVQKWLGLGAGSTLADVDLYLDYQYKLQTADAILSVLGMVNNPF